MEETQSFRLSGKNNVVKITVNHIQGQAIIYWEDIKDVFREVDYVKNGDVAISFLRDSNGIRIVPYCIKHYPGITLDIVLSSPAEIIPIDNSAALSSLVPTVGQVDTPDHALINPNNPRLSESVTTVSISAGISDDLSLAKPYQEFRSTVINKLDSLRDQGATTHELVQEVLDLQKQMNDRLVLIQSKTEAILTQNYELLEYTIPRLFIVLPDTLTQWDPLNRLRTKFRLRFICECGEHTKATGSRIPHHLHLANHEGYLINKPTEFFEKYGPVLTLMLEMIKLGTNIAGHVVPTLASLKVVDALDSAQSMIDSVTTKIIEGVDYSLKYLEENRALTQNSDNIEVVKARSSNQDLASYLAGVEGLEGMDLRQLGSYLTANSSDNLLGNLYRMTTESGHVKWVCRDHYRAGYQEALTQKLRDVVKLNSGIFDEQLARIEIALTSSITAAEFYAAIQKAKGVLDLDVSLDWNQDQTDFEKLKDMISRSNIRLIKVNLNNQTGPNINIKFSAIRRYDPILDIMQFPSIQSFQVSGVPKDFFRRSSALKKNANLSNLKYLGIVKLSNGYILEDADITKLKLLITLASTLTTLNLQHNSVGEKGAQVLAESLKTNSTLTTLNLQFNSIGEKGAQVLAEALKTNSTLTTFDLQGNKIGEYGAKALAEWLKSNSTLTILNLQNNSIGEKGAQVLAEALKTNSTLTALSLFNNLIGEKGGQELAEALKTNSTLTTLDLQYNLIGDKGARVLAEALKTNSTLTTLDLNENKIGFEGALELAFARNVNFTLNALNFKDNLIKENVFQILCDAFQTNSTLTTLDLQFSSIGEKGSYVLAEALKINSTLTTLNLQYNSIGEKGTQTLAEALKTNSTLTTVGLQSNSIGDKGAQALAEALKTNSTLTTLSLFDNLIGEKGGQELAEALKTNSTLTTLNLQYNLIGERTAQALAEVLSTNLTLSTLYLQDNKLGEIGAGILTKALKTTNGIKIFMSEFGSNDNEMVWINSVPSSVIARASKKEQIRQEVIYEFIRTEYYYVEDLDLIEEIFITPLRDSDIIDPERLEEFIEDLFMNFKEILALHKQFLADLRIRQEEQPFVESIGDILLAHIAKFEQAYMSYIPRIAISEFKSNTEQTQNLKFAQFLKDCTRHPRARRLGLRHFIGLPYQRFPRYSLLLNEIVRRTDIGVPDRETIQEVIQLCAKLYKQVDVALQRSTPLS